MNFRSIIFLFVVFTIILTVFIIFHQAPFGNFYTIQNRAKKSFVVKIVHQTWKSSNLPPRFKNWSSSWKTCFPDWEFKLWTDSDNENFIRLNYPWFLPTYVAFPKHIHRVDVVRYFYMFHYGGVYADLDAECLRPFEHLLEDNSLVFGAMDGQFGEFEIPEGYTQNSFMYSTARHPFWLELIHAISKTNLEAGVESVTGPIKLIEAINSYRKRFPSAVKIYPPNYFNPFSWLKDFKPGCQTLNRMSVEDIAKCKTHFNDSYVIQYHSQTWRYGKVLK